MNGYRDNIGPIGTSVQYHMTRKFGSIKADNNVTN